MQAMPPSPLSSASDDMSSPAVSLLLLRELMQNTLFKKQVLLSGTWEDLKRLVKWTRHFTDIFTIAY